MYVRLTGLAAVAALTLACPLAAQQDERWQVTLDGEQYVWDIRLVRLDGDSLVVRQADSLVGVSVAHITEIRLIRKSEVRSEGDGVAAMNALVGADDEIYDLTSLDLAERRRSIQKILQLHPTGP